MKYLIVGGDDRLVYLAKLLHDDGNEVSCFALDAVGLPQSVVQTDSIGAADCVVLPLPAEVRHGALNAPYSKKVHSLSEILGKIPEGTVVCGGKLSNQIRAAAEKNRLRIYDYMARPEFTVGNAAVTAEGAVAALMSNLKSTLFGSSVLVVGYGRIGKLLADKLRGLNVRTCVMSRNSEARALAEGMGLSAIAPNADAAILSAFDAVVNTAPAPFAGPLEALRHDCILLELASSPGFDAEEAAKLGLRHIAAPGLPGKYAPQTAARLIYESVQNIIGEIGK